MNPLSVAVAQVDVSVGALSPNADKIVRFAHHALEQGARLAVFPQMTLCGYPPEDLLHKEHFLEDCAAMRTRLAARLPPELAVVVGAPHGSEDAVYDALHLFHHGHCELIAARQVNLPADPLHPSAAAPAADWALGTFSLEDRTVAVLLHAPVWHADTLLSRLAHGPDASLLIDFTASPYDAGQNATREACLGAVALARGVPLLHVNLVGGQDELVFEGASLALGPDGRLAGRAKMFEEDLLEVRIPPRDAPVPEGRIEPRPVREAEIYGALALGLADYVNKNGFRKTLVALSGGIDSALVAAIAVDALGADRVVGLTMPAEITAPETRADALALAATLGMECLEVPISEIFDLCRSALAPLAPDDGWGTMEENLQARIRGLLVMAVSNKFGHLVISTGNKSELATGYCTLYGDMCGGFALLKDVTKTRVYELARWRQTRDDTPVFPTGTLERPPSAELRPGQLDTDTLPPYDVLDPILERYVERNLGFDAIVADGFPPQVVRRVIRRVDAGEYKRRQGAPGVRITPRAFMVDRHMPITNLYQERL